MTEEPGIQAFFKRSFLASLVGQDAVGALGRGALATMGINILAAVLGLVLHIVLTWALGNETQYGIYLVAVSAVSLLALPIVFGWDTVLTRFVSEYGQQGDMRDCEIVVRKASRTTLKRTLFVLPLLIVLVIPLLRFGFPKGWTHVGIATYFIVIACVPLLAMSLLRQGALRGLHRPALSLLPESLLKPLVVIAGMLVLLGLNLPRTGTVALTAHLLASIAAFVAGTLLLPKTIRRAALLLNRPGTETSEAAEPIASAEKPDATQQEMWKSLAASALVMGLAYTVLNRIDEFLLGVLDSPASAGLYGPASRFAGFVVFGLNAVNPMLGALIARHQHDRAELQRLVKRSARLAAAISTPLAIGFMALPWLPLSILPEPYQQTACVLRILAAAQWINTLFGSVGLVLTMTGHHRDLAIILVTTTLVDIGLNLLLIPQLGYLGAGIATGISIVGWNAAAWVVVRQRLGINTSAI